MSLLNSFASKSPPRPAPDLLSPSKKAKSSMEHNHSVSTDDDTPPPQSRMARPLSRGADTELLATLGKSIALVNMSRSPSPYSAWQRSAQPSEDEDEPDCVVAETDEVLSRPPVNKRQRQKQVRQPYGFKSIFRQGGLGYLLFNTETGGRVYTGLLVFWLGGCQFGLLLINRFILWTGTYKFPYPLTMTLLQLLFTHLLLLAFSSLTRGLASMFRALGFDAAVAPAYPYSTESLHSRGFRGSRRQSVWANLSHWASHNSGGIGGGGLFEFNWNIVKTVLPLAMVFVARIVLSNLSYAYAVLPVYQVSRIAIIPLSLTLTATFARTPHSVQTLSSALAATFNLLMASLQFRGVRAPWEAIVAGAFSSLFVALYPILLLRAYNKLVADLVPRDQTLLAPESDDENIDSANLGSNRCADKPTRAYYRTLHYTSLLSIIIMLPLVAISGELQQIRRNCYFLDVSWFWFLVLFSSLGSWAVFSSTLLMIKATSPLTATFVSVPRSAFQLAVLNKFRLPAHAWVGTALCWASCLWYVGTRWREEI